MHSTTLCWAMRFWLASQCAAITSSQLTSSLSKNRYAATVSLQLAHAPGMLAPGFWLSRSAALPAAPHVGSAGDLPSPTSRILPLPSPSSRPSQSKTAIVELVDLCITRCLEGGLEIRLRHGWDEHTESKVRRRSCPKQAPIRNSPVKTSWWGHDPNQLASTISEIVRFVVFSCQTCT